MRMSVGLDAVRVGLETRAHSGEGIAFADCMLCHLRVDVVSLVWEEGLFQTLLSVGWSSVYSTVLFCVKSFTWEDLAQFSIPLFH